MKCSHTEIQPKLEIVSRMTVQRASLKYNPTNDLTQPYIQIDDVIEK